MPRAKTLPKGWAASQFFRGATRICVVASTLAVLLSGCGGSQAPAAQTTAPKAGEPGALTPGAPPGGMPGAPATGGTLMPGAMPGMPGPPGGTSPTGR